MNALAILFASLAVVSFLTAHWAAVLDRTSSFTVQATHVAALFTALGTSLLLGSGVPALVYGACLFVGVVVEYNHRSRAVDSELSHLERWRR